MPVTTLARAAGGPELVIGAGDRSIDPVESDVADEVMSLLRG